MNIIQRAARVFGFERRDANPNDLWAGFEALRTGTVSPQSAQSVSAVYAAVSVISEALGSMPLKLFRRADDGDRQPAGDHPLASVLHRQPNAAQSPQEFIEWMSASMLLHGNAFAKVERGWDGQVRSLWPLAPERVQIMRKGDGIAGFEYTDRDGQRIRYLPDEVFHLRHRAGADPLVGQSPIQAARQVIELAQAEQEHGLSNFTNGTKLSGVIKMPGKLKAEQRDSLKASWQSQYAGSSNAGRTPVLDEGAEFQPLSMNLADAEWVASRKFSVQEIARIFRVPPALIGDMDNANYSNAVAMGRWFVTHCLGRHMSAWEGAIARQLLTEAGRRIYFAEFSAEGLLRGDSANRAAFYREGIASGWLLPSEARRLENLPTIDGIDERPNAAVNKQPAIHPSRE